MNQQTRIEKISEIVERDKLNPHGKQDIPWQDDLESMNVYLIPLNLLIYNKYNGRILSRTKSHEKQGHEINVETDDGKKLVEDFLLKSNEARNKLTQESLTNGGQQRAGIITKDGIIIDGNRRAMLLRRSGKYDYFKAVVLPVTLEENPLEIEKLETSFQMGEDEKLGYNATEKYLKAKFLKNRSVDSKKIASWMGELPAKVDEYLKIMEVMDDYLDYLDVDGIYTQLDKREGQFVDLSNQLSSFIKGSAKGFDGYKASDVEDLRIISYDYIRLQYEGKEFRNIGYGQKESHFFGNKAIWDSFRDFHFRHMEAIRGQESKINFDSEDLAAHLNARDKNFEKLTENGSGKSFLKENMEDHIRKLGYVKNAGQPVKLANNSLEALEAIDQHYKASSTPEVLDQIENIRNVAAKMISKKSPKRVLSDVLESLRSLEIHNTNETKDDLIEKVKEIEKVAYQLEKKLKSL
jgi:hypothetical protein